jgi:cytochrome b561
MVLADLRPFSRHLARLVYLLLYVLMFCRLIMDVASAAPRGPSCGPMKISKATWAAASWRW